MAVFLAGAREVVRLRLPAADGTYYPAEKEKLREVVTKYFNEAKSQTPPARLLACIVPHGAYGFSGAVTAEAFKELKRGQYHRVIVLAPSNYATFHGCSIPSVQGFLTPLGIISLDGPAIRKLSISPLINVRSIRYGNVPQRPQLHEKEHSIEVVLPFLQEKLGTFRLVPILVGNLTTPQGKFEPDALDAIADSVKSIMDERTLLVVSTNFTQYGESFGYEPFQDKVQEELKKLDEAAFSRVMSLDVEAFREYLQVTRNGIGGVNALMIMMRVLPREAAGRLLGYDTSGRMLGRFERSVSYASINFYDEARPPLEPSELPLDLESELDLVEPEEEDNDESAQ